ncbi:hypothetical protein [Marinoscillum sp. MHG1-6]|uniref:hypothetical protein n=1 Tax=Marinoscillum sp. MHG1-6 TaxID=2959627 RepID=UPI0021570E0F|nr:hypothetical protein [Marinoscillum sp. MHG1-6]
MRTFTVLLLLLNTLTASSQLLQNEELLKGIGSITTKSFSGSGGGGYWTYEELDELGRTISKEYHRRKELLAREEYRYNQMNDEILWVQTFDINNPSRIDSTFTTYEYNSNGTITRQKQTYSNREDSIVFDLMGIKDDTLNYSKREFYYRPNRGIVDTYSYKLSLVFNSANQLVYKREVDLQAATIEITRYEYNSNELLSRRNIVRTPEPEQEIVYVGGPGSDDMRYKYTFYVNGLTKKMYGIIEEKKYKLAEYRYK